jgi:hypothetical protein
VRSENSRDVLIVGGVVAGFEREALKNRPSLVS